MGVIPRTTALLDATVIQALGGVADRRVGVAAPPLGLLVLVGTRRRCDETCVARDTDIDRAGFNARAAANPELPFWLPPRPTARSELSIA